MTIKHSNLKVHPSTQRDCKTNFKLFFKNHIVSGSIKPVMRVTYNKEIKQLSNYAGVIENQDFIWGTVNTK